MKIRKKFRLKIWSKRIPKWNDPMEEVNLGTKEDPRITYINSILPTDLKENITSLLQELKDCFSWNYDEIPGFERSLVEHCLPIRPKFHHFQQPPRRMDVQGSRAKDKGRN